ncbi:MAG: flagellar basal-body MS-ring/collar protein FliF [bacterium]
MAEAGGFDPRRVYLVAGVAAVLIFSLIFFLVRGCAPAGGKNAGYSVIYSNLELKDAANTIARLKEVAIPYEIRDEGRSIAVPREKADQAKLALAEKNLPLGGSVGWEIFDVSKLGATDFDRRIQLIRAISGELSRTIRRIDGIDDVRVQVVIPETKLFAATTSPVTAAVMIRLRPGFELARGKINGIIHLVASSVENLQPENVTIVDDSGKILSVKGMAAAPIPAEKERTEAAKPVEPTAEVVLRKEETPKEEPKKEEPKKEEPKKPNLAIITPEVTAEAAGVTALTTEEKILLKIKAKKDLEQELSGKAQELINRFYPINSAIVKVGVEITPAKEPEIRAKDLKIKNLYSVVLVDNRLDFTPSLKEATYTTVAAAIGYNKKRGDRIIIQRVPFHLAVTTNEAPTAKTKLGIKKRSPLITAERVFWLSVITLIGLIAYGVISSRRARRKASMPPQTVEEAPIPRGKMSKLEGVRQEAGQNPERIAELLKKWLSE